MVVVKIGGSLQSTKYIRYWIKAVKLNRNTSFLLVFGGGKYADEIRRQQKIKLYPNHYLILKTDNDESEIFIAKQEATVLANN